ncbi:hypothetical protein [Aquibacillus albus]|uniref:Phage-related minor tail protein n=1 Tax=Aquibacillus albus TaxID=1168171 RepID=A0ABS2N0M0_9BACI|nr:hypothetical protein [Aquibacillus albus]MBM7571682.1 phage-related minor tail protein [Aquibacillus albus]
MKMEKSELNQILDALKLHGEQVNSKFDEMDVKVTTRIERLEKQMNDRFKQIEDVDLLTPTYLFYI